MSHLRQHEVWMGRALALARRGEGLTHPNPPVGAVVVRKGRIIGQGYHHAAGRPHAEALALQEADSKTRGATLYVTLEPCCTTGRTPPCVQAILRSGIRRVVIGARDPNPRHAGRGLRWLRRQGIGVMENVRAAEARELIAPFARWIMTGRPYVTLKLGMSADGKIADSRRCSRWITGSESRQEVQALRRSADAILVGAGTVAADNPSLLPRPARGRRPFRVILDARGMIPAGTRVLTDSARARTIMATTKHCSLRRRQAWLDRGAQVWILPGTSRRVSLSALMRRLGRMAMRTVSTATATPQKTPEYAKYRKITPAAALPGMAAKALLWVMATSALNGLIQRTACMAAWPSRHSGSRIMGME